MKKSLIFEIFLLLFSVVLLACVSAYGFYGTNLSNSADMLFGWISDLFGPFFMILLGGSSELLFEKVLLFLLLLTFIFVILSRINLFRDKIVIIIIIDVAVSLLATRFMPDTVLVRNILLPYTIFGVVLASVLPLVLYFFFVQSFDNSSTLRKILWVFFIVVFLVMWQQRESELGETSYVYLLTGLIATILLFADGTIRRIIWKEKMKQMNVTTVEEAARVIRNRLYDLGQDYNVRHSIDEAFFNREQRRLQRELRSLTKF